jgi:hypothetical protein
MNEGDIALAPRPQADGQIKNRPVVGEGQSSRQIARTVFII